jgi:hypothetical protein
MITWLLLILFDICFDGFISQHDQLMYNLFDYDISSKKLYHKRLSMNLKPCISKLKWVAYKISE